MGKNKKKRNKVYRGQDARSSSPTVTRISAVHRNPISQWWHDKRRVAKPVLIAGGIASALVLIIIELVQTLAH